MAAGVFRFFFACEGKIVLRGERVVKSIEQVKIPAESGIFKWSADGRSWMFLPLRASALHRFRKIQWIILCRMPGDFYRSTFGMERFVRIFSL